MCVVDALTVVYQLKDSKRYSTTSFSSIITQDGPPSYSHLGLRLSTNERPQSTPPLSFPEKTESEFPFSSLRTWTFPVRATRFRPCSIPAGSSGEPIRALVLVIMWSRALISNRLEEKSRAPVWSLAIVTGTKQVLFLLQLVVPLLSLVQRHLEPLYAPIANHPPEDLSAGRLGDLLDKDDASHEPLVPGGVALHHGLEFLG